ncbi:hypothetical protein FQN54_008326 [Arachnomyces sp. PD_36]|nr:hypothetical protein FQN54_008326 [Arachnomyces sp. PD_36]
MSDISGDDNVPHWAVSESICCDKSYYLTTRCNGKRFYFIVDAEELKHGELKEEFIEMVENDDLELENWVADAIVPVMRELAPEAPESLTLAEFYNPETFLFKLVGSIDGELSCIRLPDDADPEAYNSPKIPLSEVPAAQRMIPAIDASAIPIIRMDREYFGADTPSKVLVDGKRYQFKPVQDEHSFLRELGILSKLSETGLNQKLRVPSIYSLVHYAGDKGSILGFLMEVIQFKSTLHDLISHQKTEQHQREKWMGQIEDTVSQLHENGIVWGDVKPDNVLIDEEDNAWVVDYGGGFNLCFSVELQSYSGFVDEGVTETIEGDIQGVSRIKGWLGV